MRRHGLGVPMAQHVAVRASDGGSSVLLPRRLMCLGRGCGLRSYSPLDLGRAPEGARLHGPADPRVAEAVKASKAFKQFDKNS